MVGGVGWVVGWCVGACCAAGKLARIRGTWGCLELARSGVSGPTKTPRSGGFWELRLKTCEPRLGGAEARVSRVLKSGRQTSVSGF